jgi:predicted nucleic-acid-binding protein
MNFKELGYKAANIVMVFAFFFVCALITHEEIVKYEKEQIVQEQQRQEQQEQEQQQAAVNKFVNELHIKKLVDIIWCEDRTSIENAKDVLSTIVNRSKNKTSIKDLVAVATKSYQFSCNNDPGIIASQRVTKIDMVMKSRIRTLVIQAISGTFVPTHYATHYYAYRKIKKPKWAKHMAVVKVNNNHVFLI